jgi:NTE family protein
MSARAFARIVEVARSAVMASKSTRRPKPSNSTAFVLSGGGNLGAVQAGQLRALFEAGIVPDLIVGTSVGAINGAFIAGACNAGGCEALADLWTHISRADVFPARPLIGLAGFLGRRTSFVPDSGLRKLLRSALTFTDLQDAPTPIHVVACELRTGDEVLLSSGNAIDAVCASAAIPAVFPPVEIDGRTLVDGGIANNAPISHALELGATTVWVLPCGYSCAMPQQPRGALGIALQAVSVLVQQRLSVDVRRYGPEHDLRVAPSPCPINVMPTDFSQSARLMDDAYRSTRSWLDDGHPDSTIDRIRPHHH